MNKKAILYLILIHTAFFLIGTLIFILQFKIALLNNISVLFYRGIFLLILTCIFMIFIMLLYKRSKYGRIFTYRDIIVAIALLFSLNITFFTLVPVTIDRSVSVFLLGEMNSKSDASYSKQDLEAVFVQRYVHAYDGMQKRLDEQIYSGNVIEEEGTYKITDQGKALINTFNFIADLFNIDKKLVNGTN